MKYILGAFLVVLLLNSNTFSQNETNLNLIDQDKKKYEENVYNKEFDESLETDDSDRKRYDRIPEKLPNWVFKPVDFNNPARIIGFSDPNMTKEEAYKQAIMRAKALYAIYKLSSISNITDDYTNLKESGRYSLYTTKFQDFSLTKAELTYNDSAIVVIDTFFTKYNEGIALIEINTNQNSNLNRDTISIKGEHLQVFIEKNFKREKIEFFNLSIQDNLEKNDTSDFFSQYNYKIVNRGYDISSIYGNQLIEFTERTYNYRSETEFQKDSLDAEYDMFYLNKGLWNAFISGVLSNITMLSKQLSTQIKNSNDYYTQTSEGLIRTVSRNKVSFGFNNFKIIQNQFYIDLNGLIVE
jgi:hypothetical protein